MPSLRGLGIAVSAVADVCAARREAAARRVPGIRAYAERDALLAAETGLDALIITTPPHDHAGAVVAGLRAGLHVLCEKPLTLDACAFAEIRDKAESSDRAVYCVNNWAFSPQWARLTEIAASGALGAIRRAEVRVLRTRPSASALPNDWRKDPAIAGGGILVDHGWHNLYLLRRVLGAGARLVSAVLTPEGGVDELATVLLGAPGAAGVLNLSWRAPERSNAVFLLGDEGSAELRDDVLEVCANGARETARFAEKLSAGSAHPDWLTAMWPAFEAECAGIGRGESLAEAAFCLDTIRAAYAERETTRA